MNEDDKGSIMFILLFLFISCLFGRFIRCLFLALGQKGQAINQATLIYTTATEEEKMVQDAAIYEHYS